MNASGKTTSLAPPAAASAISASALAMLAALSKSTDPAWTTATRSDIASCYSGVRNPGCTPSAERDDPAWRSFPVSRIHFSWPVTADIGNERGAMSRKLPERPNLEHLKKQAKELLRDLPAGKLADAQHALANEYGFATWAKLKVHVESLVNPAEALRTAVCDSDAACVRELLQRYPELRARINDALPDYGFGGTALFAAVQRSDRESIDALLASGANVNQRNHWWAGGFGA